MSVKDNPARFPTEEHVPTEAARHAAQKQTARVPVRSQPPQESTSADLERVLEGHFAKLSTIGIEPDGSISRIAWSDAESAAMAYIRAEGETFGLVGWYDGVGNLMLSTPGRTEERILVGSHIDSVPSGGNYDGSAGILAGLEALRHLMNEGVDLRRGIDLVIWRGEEYTFNAVYKGSAAAFGLSETHVLHNLYAGQSLRDAIGGQSFDPSYIDSCRPSFEPAYIDAIAAYLELHIEQGVCLERERRDIGVVTGIAGDRRYLVVLEGRFDHSGATPMGTAYRSDVNLAMAYILTRMDELGAKRRAEGHEFVQTVGIINADPEIDKKYPNVFSNSVTKVSGQGYFTIDFMGADDTFLDACAAEVHRLIWNTAKEFGAKAIIEQTDASAGIATLDSTLRELIATRAGALGLSSLDLPSGAGHDAAMVAQVRKPDGGRIPVGMIFIPCKGGISHSKAEYTSPAQVARGTEVLRDVLRELATKATD